MTFPLLPLLPLMIIAATLVVSMVAISVHRSHRTTFCLTLAGILAALAGLVALLPLIPAQAGLLFLFDGFALVMSALVLAAGFLVAVLSYDYLKGRDTAPEEFYLLLLGALLGALALINARHFVSFFSGSRSAEHLPVPVDRLPARQALSHGSGYQISDRVRRVVGVFVYGMAIIYGLTGTMEFALLGPKISGLVDGRTAAMAGMVFLVAGIGFKLGVVPFHMWTPDVYEGAPAPVTAFIATVSKGAVFALFLRYFTDVSLRDHPNILLVFTVIAVASMAAGNLLALFQRNIKRLLAYSSIAHFGYLLVAFISTGPFRVMAVTYYLVAYFVTTLGAFGVVTLLSPSVRDADAIEDYEGLFWRRPWLAGTFTLMLLSLAGMPLTAGFIGKAYIVVAGVGSFHWLPVIVLVVTSAIGLFYYLRVIAALYKNARPTPAFTPAALKGRAVMILLFILLIWWGVYPGALIALIGRISLAP